MKRPSLRAILVVALLISAGFAAWAWFRPYSWRIDPGARCSVVGAQVTRDQSYYWVEIHLQVTPGETHDPMKPVLLHTANGRDLKPADTLTATEENRGITEIWYKFWLESADLEGPLNLRINDGTLVIKSNHGLPAPGRSAIQYHVTNRW